MSPTPPTPVVDSPRKRGRPKNLVPKRQNATVTRKEDWDGSTMSGSKKGKMVQDERAIESSQGGKVHAASAKKSMKGKKIQDVCVPVRRISTRRHSTLSLAGGCSLNQEFTEIIRNASLKVGSEAQVSPLKVESQAQVSPLKVESQAQVLPLKVMSDAQVSPMKCIKIQLHKITTPYTPHVKKLYDSIVPSPVTPPIPRKILCLRDEEDDAPSPQAMISTPPSSVLQLSQPKAKSPEKKGAIFQPSNQELFPNKTQPTSSPPEEPCDEELVFQDALDTTDHANSTLDLANILNEYLTPSTTLDPDQSKQEISLGFSSVGSLNFSLESEKSELAHQTQHNVTDKTHGQEKGLDVSANSESNKEERTHVRQHTDCQSDKVPRNLQALSVTDQGVVSDVAEGMSSAHNQQLTKETKRSSSEETNGKDPENTEENSASSCQLTSNNLPKDAPVKETNRYDEPEGKESESDEHFCEELPLSHSQYLDIDAKCSLVNNCVSNISVNQDLANHPRRTEHDNSANNPLLEQPNIHQGLGFPVPSGPQMPWIQKTVNIHRHLQSTVQEISRMNALILRARRTLWPRRSNHQEVPASAMQQQPLQTQPTSSQPQPSVHRESPDMFSEMNDPDWNIS